ncbi:MAG: alpha-hydroxy-acid oxidizing protein [Chloroflexi bacterium]|nr:alpha-hydroxy-acid oxidizing protein [Chloroflexota bacterium]
MIVNIDDLRKVARRRLPRAIFDYVDGGAEDEYTMRANQADFRRYTFRPRVMVDVSQRNQATTVLGERVATPIILAPTGFTGMLWPRGEVVAARAAARKGAIFTVSTMSICSMEEVAEASSGPRWFQLYVWRDREIVRSLIERAKAAGYRVLVITVDTPVLGQRERDIRNGMVIPPRIGANNVLDTLRRVAWLKDFVRNPRITFGNFKDTLGVRHDPVSLASFTTKQFSPAVSWDDLDWYRSVWSGPIAIKGIMSAEDARLAVEHGVEAIVVSNHGGRQCDYLPSAVEVLPEVVDAVGGRAEVILDGGIRRGSDVVKAIALGARACMIGKAFNYGVAAGGQAGAERALDILMAEIDRTLALIGRPHLSDLDRGAIRATGAY